MYVLPDTNESSTSYSTWFLTRVPAPGNDVLCEFARNQYCQNLINNWPLYLYKNLTNIILDKHNHSMKDLRSPDT